MTQTRAMAGKQKQQDQNTTSKGNEQGLSYSDQLIKTFIDIAKQKIADLEGAMNHVMAENTELRDNVSKLHKRVQLQDGLIARLTSKLDQQDTQLTDLRARSMRDNIVLTGIIEDDRESWDTTKHKVKTFLKEELKIPNPDDVLIDRAHRSGMKSEKSRPVIVKLKDTASKDVVFRNVKHLKGKPQYSVQEQLPAEVMERRKRLWSKYKAAKSNPANKVSWVLDKLNINGVTYTAHDDKQDLLDKEISDNDINIVHTTHMVTEGSTFIGHAAEISKKSEVPAVLAGLMSDPMIAGATHNIYAYRYDDPTKPNGVMEGLSDDGEHGAGYKLLKSLQEGMHKNIMVIVTRVYGNKHMGPKRFDCIRECANDAIALL